MHIVNVANNSLRMLVDLRYVNSLVCYAGIMLMGNVEVWEGTVVWVVRRILNPLTKEIDIVENYEFVEFNRENIDVDNPPRYLEKYCDYILELESITLEIL